MADLPEIHRVDGRGDLKRFVRVPWSLYRDDANWVPPLMAERMGHLNRKTNPYFAGAEAAFWIAVRGGRAVGRISAQVNRAHLERYGDATGHFGFLEGTDEGEVFQALTGTAEAWLRERGMARVLGPFSLSINDESGLLVDGFDTPPSLMMGHARPYYARRLEEQGYRKAKDLIAYAYDPQSPMPRGAAAMAERVREAPGISLRCLDKSRYDADLAAILDIFNDAWSENWGFLPMTPADVRHAARELKPLITEDLVAIAEVDGVPVAMAVALLNLNEAIADLDGSLLPFGWARLLWRLKTGKVRTARVALMGVRRDYHATPLGAALAFAVIGEIRKAGLHRGLTHGELSWVLEDNKPMDRMIAAVGGRPYKTYRIYEKGLS